MGGVGRGILACNNFFFGPLPVYEFFFDCSFMHEFLFEIIWFMYNLLLN